MVLSTSVLVLNRLYQPVHVTSVRRALILLYRGAAKAVDEQYQTFDFESWAELAVAVHDESIGTSSRRLKVPREALSSIGVHAVSAGLSAQPGDAMAIEAQQALERLKMPAPVHRSQNLTLELAARGSAACGAPVEVRPFQENPEA